MNSEQIAILVIGIIVGGMVLFTLYWVIVNITNDVLEYIFTKRMNKMYPGYNSVFRECVFDDRGQFTASNILYKQINIYKDYCGHVMNVDKKGNILSEIKSPHNIVRVYGNYVYYGNITGNGISVLLKSFGYIYNMCIIPDSKILVALTETDTKSIDLIEKKFYQVTVTCNDGNEYDSYFIETMIKFNPIYNSLVDMVNNQSTQLTDFDMFNNIKIVPSSINTIKAYVITRLYVTGNLELDEFIYSDTKKLGAVIYDSPSKW